MRRSAFLLLLTAACTCRVATPPPQAEREAAGVRYLERMTGGARPDERVPMIVVLHPMGGDPADLQDLLSRYERRARLVFPYGHPRGGKYFWYDSASEDVPAAMVKPVADRLAAFLSALVAERPTVGAPLVTGFSQGANMTWALAVTHPEAMAAAFPVSGSLPRSLAPSTTVVAATRPPRIVAFHGGDDLAVPTQSARTSASELQRAGYVVEFHEYAGLGHETNDVELRELNERLAAAADAL